MQRARLGREEPGMLLLAHQCRHLAHSCGVGSIERPQQVAHGCKKQLSSDEQENICNSVDCVGRRLPGHSHEQRCKGCIDLFGITVQTLPDLFTHLFCRNQAAVMKMEVSRASFSEESLIDSTQVCASAGICKHRRSSIDESVKIG
eukprot:516450-Pleurochrysis_carterae.AAC.2